MYGFPSPAEDYTETPLDLNEHLIQNRAATFFVRAQGDSMEGAGIFDGDLLIIDRSVKARHNRIVLVVINGEFTLKRLDQKAGKIRLVPENSKYKPIEVTQEMEFKVWGVATTCIHRL